MRCIRVVMVNLYRWLSKMNIKYKTQQITTATDLSKHWEFIRKGLDEMADPRRANLRLPEDEFYKVCLYALTHGHILLVRDLNQAGKPIAFAVGFENTPMFANERVFLVYAVYVPIDDPQLSVEMMDYCADVASEQGIYIIETYARRINGAAFRYYEGKHKFRRSALVFRKTLERKVA